MSCWLCEHAQEVIQRGYKENDAEQKRLGLDYTEYREQLMFNCRLNPVWIKVAGSHVCGQFRDGHFASPYHVTEIRNRQGAYSDEARRMKERAIAAERKLKAANAKLRELRAKRDG